LLDLLDIAENFSITYLLVVKKIFQSEASFYSVLFSYISLFLYGLLDNMRGPIYPSLLAKYDLNNVIGSLFFSATSSVFMLAAALAPKVLFKRGYLKSVRESLFVIFVSQVIFYLAPNFLLILVGCVLMGYGVGILSVVQNVLVLIASPQKYASRIMNGLHANYAAASLLAPLIVALIFRNGLSFKFVFFIGGLLSLIIFIGSYLVTRVEEPVRTESPDMKSLFKFKYLSIGVLLSSYVAGEVLISSRLAQFLTNTHGFSNEQASLWTSGFFVALLAGRLTFTAFHFEVSLKKLLKILFFVAIVLSIVGIYVSPVLLICVGFVVSPLYAMIMILAKKEFPDEIERITSLVIVLSGVFIIAMHFAVGYLTDLFNIQIGLNLAPAFFILCLILLWRGFGNN